MLGAGSAAGPNLAAIVSRAACSFAGGLASDPVCDRPAAKEVEEGEEEEQESRRRFGGAAGGSVEEEEEEEGGGMSCNSIEVAVALWQREKGN